MVTPEKRSYEFGPFRLDPAERLLLREGEPVPLEPKVFDTLVLLVRNGGRLLGKEELIDNVWPDAVVEEGSLTRNISALRRALGEGEDGLRYIETVPRRGYRFVAGVRVLRDESPDPLKEERVRAQGVGGEKTGVSVTRLPSRAGCRVGSGVRCVSGAAVVVALVLVIAAATVGYAYLARGGKTAIDSVAVLPFADAGDDPNIEYVSNGVTEYLINDLSQLPRLKVIARSAAFTYKGKEVDPQEVAQSLGVGAIVTGRIVRRGDDLEISVELMDTRDKTRIWGGQYHRRASDFEAARAEVSRAIAEKLREALVSTPEEEDKPRPGLS
jgi:DNA-binding winged helix-turn-helix (wHTH) protein/TolB-like protein